MPQFDEHEKIEAWNNLAAMIKFLSLEEYMKIATVQDFVSSLNKLTPHPNEEDEIINNEIINGSYKETPGFITEKETVISAITEDLIALMKDIFKEDEGEAIKILQEQFKGVLRNHIEKTNNE